MCVNFDTQPLCLQGIKPFNQSYWFVFVYTRCSTFTQ